MKAATALVVLVMREVAPGRRVFQKETPVCPAHWVTAGASPGSWQFPVHYKLHLAPEKDLESPSSTSLESLVPSRDSRARTHRRQPTRIHCPWDSPGKNTGVGCHVLLQCMKVESENEVAQWGRAAPEQQGARRTR